MGYGVWTDPDRYNTYFQELLFRSLLFLMLGDSLIVLYVIYFETQVRRLCSHPEPQVYFICKIHTNIPTPTRLRTKLQTVKKHENKLNATT